MAKPMYNAREAASGATVSEIQEFYKKVLPAINRYESKVYDAEQKNKKPETVKDTISKYVAFLGVLAFLGAWGWLLFYAIDNINNPFLLSMTILAIVVGVPFALIFAFVRHAIKSPDTSGPKGHSVKFPLREEEKQFRKLIQKLGEELGCGSKLNIFVNHRPDSISFKTPLPKHILFRGSNDDPSKRSFLFEVEEDEITILLPDGAGVYKYDKKPKNYDTNIPDGNFPRYAGEAPAIISDIF